MKSEAQKRARQKYAKTKIKKFTLDCYPTDADIKEKLKEEKQNGGYATYIKRLIREDLAKQKGEEEAQDE